MPHDETRRVAIPGPRMTLKTWEECLLERCAEAEAERDRLAKALLKIADKAKYLSEPAWDLEGCALVGAQIHRWASEALDAKETSA